MMVRRLVVTGEVKNLWQPATAFSLGGLSLKSKTCGSLQRPFPWKVYPRGSCGAVHEIRQKNQPEPKMVLTLKESLDGPVVPEFTLWRAPRLPRCIFFRDGILDKLLVPSSQKLKSPKPERLAGRGRLVQAEVRKRWGACVGLGVKLSSDRFGL